MTTTFVLGGALRQAGPGGMTGHMVAALAESAEGTGCGAACGGRWRGRGSSAAVDEGCHFGRAGCNAQARTKPCGDNTPESGITRPGGRDGTSRLVPGVTCPGRPPSAGWRRYARPSG